MQCFSVGEQFNLHEITLIAWQYFIRAGFCHCESGNGLLECLAQDFGCCDFLIWILKKNSTGLLCLYFHFFHHELINRLQSSLEIEKTFTIKAIANGSVSVNKLLK